MQKKGGFLFKKKVMQLRNAHTVYHLRKKYYREYVVRFEPFIFSLVLIVCEKHAEKQ